MGAKGIYFDAFWVDEPTGHRWDAALELLREGNTIVYQGVGLSVRGSELLVEVPAWVDVGAMPAPVATRALAKTEEMIDKLQSDARFADLASGRKIEIRLIDESYGWLYATRRAGETIFTDLWLRHHPRNS